MSRFEQAVLDKALLCGKALIFNEIDSTNAYLLDHHHTLASGTLCLATSQRAGRGRRGRQWYSPESDNLYFSMLWRFPQNELARLPSLSLAVAVVIVETFQEFEVEGLQIKWPNDIYFRGKKMGGILIESLPSSEDIVLVIGIGLNLGMSQVEVTKITQEWADLSEYKFNHSELVATLAQRLQHALNDFVNTGFTPYLSRFQEKDIFYHKPVKLLMEMDEVHGFSQGVNERGELLLEQGNTIQAYAIGEISLRAE